MRTLQTLLATPEYAELSDSAAADLANEIVAITEC